MASEPKPVTVFVCEHCAAKYNPAFPKVGTRAAQQFYKSWSTVKCFMEWVLIMTVKIDDTAKIARDTLIETASSAEERRELQARWEGTGTMMDVLHANRQLFLEVVLVRHVENYLNYLSSLLFEIFTQRPETLRSSETVEVATVLNHDTLDDLVRTLAEKKVGALSYSSFQDLADFFQQRFGLQLFDEKDVPTVVEAVETRNISVHNRCVINRRYCRRTGADSSRIGQIRSLLPTDVDRLCELCFESVKRLDKETRAKLKLRASRFRVERPPLHLEPQGLAREARPKRVAPTGRKRKDP